MSNFKVVVRVRPLSELEKLKFSQPAIELGDDSSIVVHNVKLDSKKSGQADSRCRKKRFYFDKIFWSVDPNHTCYASQETVYNDLSPDLLDHVFAGYNVCLLAYGQTGSGKTYTMMGNKENPGFIPRLCEGLFDKMSRSLWEEKVSGENVSFNVSASYIEIYNERVYDLLEPLYSPHHLKNSKCRHHHYQHQRRNHHHHHLYGHQKALRVREHPKTGPYVEGLSQHTIKDNLSIQKLIKRGNLFRKTSSTIAHNTSSRSHAIFSISFTQAILDAEHPMERRSKINFVDLAGSERADSSSEVDKLRMKEGSDINKSLATLGSVIQALAQRSLLLTWNIPSFSPQPPSSNNSSPCPPHRRHGNGTLNKLNSTNNSSSSNGSINKLSKPHRQVHVPYRDSTLTWILKDSLEGNAVSVMIAAISPSSCSYFETINTLYYGQRAKTIVNKPVVNEDPTTKLICDLKAEIRRLKNLLSDQQNSSIIDKQLDLKTSSCQVDQSVSPRPMTVASACQISEQLLLDEHKVNALTRDFMEKWRKMEDIDVEVTPLNSSTVEIFTNVPHLVSIQGGDDDDDDDDVHADIGIRIFKLQIGDTIINLSEMIKPADQDDDDDDDDDYNDGYDDDVNNEVGQALCIFRNHSNVITMIPPISSSSPTSHASAFSSSSTNRLTPPPLPPYPPPPPSSPRLLPNSSSSSLVISDYHSPTSSSYKVYINDVLITRPCKPKQGDIIRFGKRLKFKFVNPYMMMRRTKRRRRSLVTSHKHHEDLGGFLPNLPSTSPSSTILRCCSLTLMPKRGCDLDVSSDFSFMNASDRSCLSDLLIDDGDPNHSPSLSLTWPCFPGDPNASRDESDAVRVYKQNRGKNDGEENDQFRNEMELQISALEKAWSHCLDKEAELRMNHENNKKDLDERIANLNSRELSLKSSILSERKILDKDSHITSDIHDYHTSRNLPKAIEAVENQMRQEREAILRLERDYKERDEKMFEEVASMHRQIELLKKQLQSLTPNFSETNFSEDNLSRGFFLQQINTNHTQFKKSFPSSNLFSPFPSVSGSVIDLRSSTVSRLSKSLDSISLNTQDSLEHSSMETVSSQASLLFPPVTTGTDHKIIISSEPVINSSIDYTKPTTNYYIDQNEVTIHEGDSKFKYSKRLSPVGSEYDKPNEFVDLIDSPKSFATAYVIVSSGNFTNVTITPAIITPHSEDVLTMISDQNVSYIEYANYQRSSTCPPFHENDSDFSNFSTDSLDHKIHKPVINFTYDYQQVPPRPSHPVSPATPSGIQRSDSKGDSGAECSSNGSGTGDGQSGKEEEDEFDLERITSSLDVTFEQSFSDENTGDSEEKADVDDVNSFENIFEQDLTTDISDWEAILGRMSLHGMPLRSINALKKSKLKSNSLNNIKTSEKSEVPFSFDNESEINKDKSAISKDESEIDKDGSSTVLHDTDTTLTLKSSELLTDNSSLDEFTESSHGLKTYGLTDYEQEKLFLEELDAELKRFEALEDDENRFKYFLKGNQLVAIVPNQSGPNTNNHLYQEILKDSVALMDYTSDQYKSQIQKTESENVTLRNVREFATDMVASIFKSLGNSKPIMVKDNIKPIRENITSTTIPLRPATSKVYARSGSGQRKHVRFNLNDLSTSYHEDTDYVKEKRSILNKRLSFSLEDLRNLLDKSQTGKPEIEKAMNMKRRSEENIRISRNSLELYDLELGKDGRMKMKKHKKRPNLLEIDFANQSELNDVGKEKFVDNFGITSKHSITSNDSGVSTALTPPSPDQFAQDKNISCYSTEFTSDTFLNEKSLMTNDSDSLFLNNLKADGKEENVEGTSLKLFSLDMHYKMPEIDYNEQLNMLQSQENYVINFRNTNANQHNPSIISKSSVSYSKTLPDTNASPLSDFEGLSTRSVSCDGTDTGERAESFEYIMKDDKQDQSIRTEGVNKIINDNIYQNIRTYQSAVARAQENNKLISEKFESNKNIHSNLECQNLLKERDEYHIVHNTIPNDTDKKNARQNQNINSSNILSGGFLCKKTHVHTENKGVSCDLTEQNIDEANDSKRRKFYYDKTEVLGFDFYPPSECLYLNSMNLNTRAINLVTGSKSTICYPAEGKHDKEFEYFGLEPIHEHVEPTMDEATNGLIDDVIVTSLISDDDVRELVRCSYDIEIRSNNKKEVFNDNDDEDDESLNIVNSSEIPPVISTTEDILSKTDFTSGSIIEAMDISSRDKQDAEQFYDQKLLHDFPKENLNVNENVFQKFGKTDCLVRLPIDFVKSDFLENYDSNIHQLSGNLKKIENINILNSKYDSYVTTACETSEIENEDVKALIQYEMQKRDPSQLNSVLTTSHKTHIQNNIDENMSTQSSSIHPKQITSEGDAPQYVSELKIFLDTSIDQIDTSKETNNFATDLLNNPQTRNIKDDDVTILPVLHKSQSENISQNLSQPVSNLMTMSHLSKSDKDLLGADVFMFEGLMPMFKELPKCISGNSKLCDFAEQLESSTVVGVESKDVNKTLRYETASRKYLEKSDDLLNKRSINFSVYDDGDKPVNGFNTPRVERKHSNSLGDLRMSEHESIQKIQDAYDSIDSITLVLVDPGVDEVCGTETKQYLNGHSSLKNISQYGVKIQKIGGDSQYDVSESDEEEKTIEAPHEQEDSEDEAGVKMIESGGEDDDDDDNDHEGMNLYPYKDFRCYDSADGDRGNVSCYVLNSDNSIKGQDVEQFNIVDKNESSFRGMNLIFEDSDYKASLKEFSHVLTQSVPIKDDSRTIKKHHHDHQSEKIKKNFYDHEPGNVELIKTEPYKFNESKKTETFKSSSSHFSTFVTEPEKHVSVYDTFRDHQHYSSANIRHTDDRLIGYCRTIETQTYPERRIIETQTSPPLSRKPADSYRSYDSYSTKPTDDVVYHIQNTLNDLDTGTQRLWHSFPRTDSLKSSELKDKSFSTETRQASESEASYTIFNNVSTRVTEFSEDQPYGDSGESQKSTTNEDSFREFSPPSYVTTHNRLKSPTTDRFLDAFDNKDKSAQFYKDNVGRSNSMAEVRTCIEEELMEPYFSNGEALDQLSRSHPIRFIPAVTRLKGDMFQYGMTVPQSVSLKSAKSSTSRKHDLAKRSRRYSPVHDSGMEDRFTNTPIRLSDRGSTSPGAFAIFRGPRDACTSTGDVRHFHLKAQSLSRLNGSEHRDSWKSEINRLRREKRKIIELLAKRVVPSKVQIELSEAQLNYHLGQTDLYLNLLEESDFPSDNKETSRSLDDFHDYYQEEMNDYPIIRFNADFLARRCERLEASRKKIEERLSRIESIRVESDSIQKPSQTSARCLSSGRSLEDSKDLKKLEKRFISATSSPIKNCVSSIDGKMFQSHRESSLNSPHHLDDASRRFAERLSCSDQSDSLLFGRTSEAEKFELSGNVMSRRNNPGSKRQIGRYTQDEHETRRRNSYQGRIFPLEIKQDKDTHESRIKFEKRKIISSNEDRYSKRESSFKPLVKHDHMRLERNYDDEDDYKLLIDCYDARKRSEDEVRKSQEFLEQTSL